MELYQLEQFLAIAESGSMHAAAQKRYVSESALSQNLKKLEAELGVQLFDRRKGRLYLNRSGALLKQHAERIRSEVDETLYELHRQAGTTNKVIRFGSIDNGAFSYIMPVFVETTGAFTEDRIINDESILRQELIRGTMDIAVVTTVYPEDQYHLACMPVLRENYYVSVPKGNPLYEKEVLLPEDLEGEPFVRDKAGLDAAMDDYLARRRVHINSVSFMDRTGFSLMSGAGEYLFFVNVCRLIQCREESHRRIIKLQLNDPEMEKPMYLASLPFNKNAIFVKNWARKNFPVMFSRYPEVVMTDTIRGYSLNDELDIAARRELGI